MQSIAGVAALDTTIQRTNIWLKEVMEETGIDDRHQAYLILRSVLHSLRDRLTAEEATDFGAQLPMLIRGFYYDEWQPSGKPVKFDREEFLANIQEQFVKQPQVDASVMARSVFRIIDRHIDSGEIEDIKDILPRDIKEFWENQD